MLVVVLQKKKGCYAFRNDIFKLLQCKKTIRSYLNFRKSMIKVHAAALVGKALTHRKRRNPQAKPLSLVH